MNWNTAYRVKTTAYGTAYLLRKYLRLIVRLGDRDPYRGHVAPTLPPLKR